MSDEIKNSMEVLTKAMIDDDPSVGGSYAHSWHCNIAMACYDAMNSAGYTDHDARYKTANDAASRFMKLCFNVETKG